MRSRTELAALLFCCACGGQIEEDARDGAAGDATVRDASLEGGSSDASQTDAATDGAIADAATDAGKDAAVMDAGMDAAVMMDASVSGEPSQLTGITAAHNVVRANVSPAPSTALPPLTWSNTLATAAQTWANTCTWGHTPNNPYGQNIYAVAPSGATGQSVVNSWASEASNYDYANNSCAATKVCGHYTQVVWRNSTQLGCAFRACTTGSPFSGFPNWQIVVCNYSPPGNNGNRPY